MINVPKAIELAIADAIRNYADGLAGDVAVRAWQSIRETAIKPAVSRAFPCIDIRCSPPEVDQNGHTLSCVAAIMCGTQVEDDEDHAVVVALYEAAQGVCDSLYAQDQSGTDGAELTAFKAVLTERAPGIAYGGLTFEAGTAPNDDEGLNMIGIALRIHYSREF